MRKRLYCAKNRELGPGRNYVRNGACKKAGKGKRKSMKRKSKAPHPPADDISKTNVVKDVERNGTKDNKIAEQQRIIAEQKNEMKQMKSK